MATRNTAGALGARAASRARKNRAPRRKIGRVKASKAACVVGTASHGRKNRRAVRQQCGDDAPGWPDAKDTFSAMGVQARREMEAAAELRKEALAAKRAAAKKRASAKKATAKKVTAKKKTTAKKKAAKKTSTAKTSTSSAKKTAKKKAAKKTSSAGTAAARKKAKKKTKKATRKRAA